MKPIVLYIMVFLTVIAQSGYAQEKTKKELKKERKLEKIRQIEEIVNAKEFVFVARTAIPMGMRSVDLTTNPNSVRFHPDLIESQMPYFGTAYSPAGYGGDTGLKFSGKPEEFTVIENKIGFEVNIVVKGERDNYKVTLLIGSEGSASLTITSNNRSTISYNGEISLPEKQER